MTSSTNVSANVPFSCMKAVYMDRSIEKSLAKGVSTKKDIIVTNSDYTRQT